MIAQRFAWLVGVMAVASSCAAGTTMRVADDEESEDGPVALAPAPDPDPDSLAAPTPPPAYPESTASQAPPAAQGYAPYGNTADLEVRRVGRWTRTGISESRRLVIRNANAWAEFWSELGVGDRPEVDFSQDVVVVVAAGQRPSGGHEIAIERVSETNGALTIGVVETTPGPNCMTTSSLTQPVDVVVVPGVSARSWSFTERKEVRGCR